MATLIAVVAAVAAGSVFAVSSVLQQRAAAGMPSDDSLSPRLLVGLVRRPDWVAGMGSAVLSFALQALALAFGPLALVQPIIVCELLFAVPLSVRLSGRRLGRREWFGTAAVAVGLVTFLTAAQPSEGTGSPPASTWVLVLFAVAVVVVLSVGFGRSMSGPGRASLYAVAAGSTYGLLAAVTKAVMHLFREGAGPLFTSWQPYSLAVIGLLGLLFGQSAFQAGPLPWSLPVIDAVEPVVAILVGVVAFGESVSVAALPLGFEVVGFGLLATGVFVLDTSPLVLALHDVVVGRTSRDHPASRARTSST